MSTTCQSEEANDLDDTQFQKIHLIGRGGNSTVHLVKHIETGLLCAMKEISKSHIIKP
jgi:serine/threonine protein kinase